MPRLTGMLADAGEAGVALKFVADTPTITMSRLKAILTGGLPTFLDIGQSFSAAAISEDNLLAQMRARGMRLVVMGDDTWAQLAPPGTYTACHPYPAFDVRDLHSVDDGVWQHLLPHLHNPAGGNNEVARGGHGVSSGQSEAAGGEAVSGAASPAGGGGGGWDVLVAHYLGVDHAGHTYGGDSPEMHDKLRQMDEHVATVAEELLAGAGGSDGGVEAGPYSRTLLLVMGDHGQTMSGDHGGGSDEERNSVLLAFDVGRWKWERRNGAASAGATAATANATGFGAITAKANAKSTAEAEAAAATAITGRVKPEPEVAPQIDLTPTLALLLGLPIPYGNLGKVNRRLWDMAHMGELPPGHRTAPAASQLSCPGVSTGGTAGGAVADSSAVDPGIDPAADAGFATGSSATGGRAVSDGVGMQCPRSYLAALRANAVQVSRYLASYAARGGLPSGELAHCRQLLRAAHEGFARLGCAGHCSGRDSGNGGHDVHDVHDGGSSGEGQGQAQSIGGDGVGRWSRPQGGAAAGEPTPEGARTLTGDLDCAAGGASAAGAAADDQQQQQEDAEAAYGAFLEAAATLARRKFTRFDLPCIAAGCGLALGNVALHGWLLGRLCRWRDLLRSAVGGSAVAAAIAHAAGLFGASWIQGEGRIQCYSLAAASVLLWLRATACGDEGYDGNEGDGRGGNGSTDAQAAATVGTATGTAAASAQQTAVVAGGTVGVDGATQGKEIGRDGRGGGDGCRHAGRRGGVNRQARAVSEVAGVAAQLLPSPPSSTPAAAPDGDRRIVCAAPVDAIPLAASLSLSSRLQEGSEPRRLQLGALQRHHLHHHHPQQRPRLHQRWRCDWWSSSRRQARLACMLAVALVCNFTLQRYSLIDRWGSDPHDKRQLAAAGFEPPGPSPVLQPPLQQQQALLLSALEVLMPLGLLPALLGAMLRRPWCGDSGEEGGRGSGGSPAEQSATQEGFRRPDAGRRRRGWRWLQWQLLGAAPFQLLSAWWALQLTGLENVSLHVVAEATMAAALAPLRALLAASASAASAPLLQVHLCLVSVVRMAARFPAAEWLGARTAAVLALPLRLLLPRLVYGLVGLALLQVLLLPAVCTASAVAAAAWARRRRRQEQELQNAAGTNKETAATAAAAPARVVAVRDAACVAVSGSTAVVTMLLGRRGPAVMLLLWAHGLTMFGLLMEAAYGRLGSRVSRRQRSSCRSHPLAAAAAKGAGDGCSTMDAAAGDSKAGAAAMQLEVAAGGLLAALGTQAFFLTSHFCEFSGLQYDSPFVGFDHMSWPATPTLFLLNSFGSLVLPALALPLAAAATAGAAKAAEHVGAGAAMARPASEPGGCCEAPGRYSAHGRPPGATKRPSRNDGQCTSSQQQAIEPQQYEVAATNGAHGGGRGATSKPVFGTGAGQAYGVGSYGGGAAMLVCLSGWRSLSLCVAMLNAAVQRHHVVVWALFAPKLVFEVCFAAATYAALLLAAPVAATAAAVVTGAAASF